MFAVAAYENGEIIVVPEKQKQLEEKYMNYWEGNKICLRAMEESDADFFYETLQDMDIQKMNQT